MRPTLTVMAAEREHVALLAPRLRSKDAEEVRNAGTNPHKTLWRSWRGSIFARTAFVDGEIAAMWGLGGTTLGMTGRPWFLTSPPIERIPIAFVRTAREEVAMMLSICPRLSGFVDDNYRGALRLLQALGFELTEPFPFGPYGLPFRRYEMRRA